MVFLEETLNNSLPKGRRLKCRAAEHQHLSKGHNIILHTKVIKAFKAEDKLTH